MAGHRLRWCRGQRQIENQCATNQNNSSFSSTIVSVVNIACPRSATSFYPKTTGYIRRDPNSALTARVGEASTMGRTEKFVRALHLVYYHLPAAVIDQSEQDIAYAPTRLTQFFNLDPPSRRPIMPVPLLRYASGIVYHPRILQAQISAYVGAR